MTESRRDLPTSRDEPAWVHFPRVAAYLEDLPAGLASYPECHARSGLVQAFLEAAPARRELDPLVAELLPPAGGWVPEVAFLALLLGVADAARMSDAGFLEWNRATNRDLYRGLVYRALMAIFSPAMLLERAPARWSSFHRGTTLSVTHAGRNEATASLTFPPRLYTRLLLEAYAGAFSAGFEHARGHEVRVELVEGGDRAARFRATWR